MFAAFKFMGQQRYCNTYTQTKYTRVANQDLLQKFYHLRYRQNRRQATKMVPQICK